MVFVFRHDEGRSFRDDGEELLLLPLLLLVSYSTGLFFLFPFAASANRTDLLSLL